MKLNNGRTWRALRRWIAAGSAALLPVSVAAGGYETLWRAAPVEAVTLEPADLWNYPNINFFRCVQLASPSVPLRYADGSKISDNGHYRVYDTATYRGSPEDHAQYCPPGYARLDSQEAIHLADGEVLFFHKGGGGYANPTMVSYGHLAASDLLFPDSIETNRPREVSPDEGAPSLVPGTRYVWNQDERNGRACLPLDDPVNRYRYRVHPVGDPDALPPGWQYKPGDVGAPLLAKYSHAGTITAERSEAYAYLVWSWMHKGDGVTTSPGGGMVRALIKDGQPFHRSPVEPIDSIAYARHTDQEAGRVTAVYGRTRTSSNGPWLYGWAVFSHRVRNADGSYGPTVYHMEHCLDGDLH